MLETRIETGEVIAVGASCLTPFYLGALRSVAGMLTAGEGAEYGKVLADITMMPVWGMETAADPALPANEADGVLTQAETGKVTDDGGDPGAIAAIVAGTEDASVDGAGITVTADQLDGCTCEPVNGSHRPGCPWAVQSARRARNRAGTPK